MVVNVLKDLAQSGCTVLCTIHQPSSEVFHLFDRVLLLSEGRTFYDGTVDNLGSYLDTQGLSVPNETNPADHVMFILQTLDKAKLATDAEEKLAAALLAASKNVIFFQLFSDVSFNFDSFQIKV